MTFDKMLEGRVRELEDVVAFQARVLARLVAGRDHTRLFEIGHGLPADAGLPPGRRDVPATHMCAGAERD